MQLQGPDNSLCTIDNEKKQSTASDVKELRKKMRNRQSAQRARDRQKARMRWLEREVTILTTRNQDLQNENRALRNLFGDELCDAMIEKSSNTGVQTAARIDMMKRIQSTRLQIRKTPALKKFQTNNVNIVEKATILKDGKRVQEAILLNDTRDSQPKINHGIPAAQEALLNGGMKGILNKSLDGEWDRTESHGGGSITNYYCPTSNAHYSLGLNDHSGHEAKDDTILHYGLLFPPVHRKLIDWPNVGKNMMDSCLQPVVVPFGFPSCNNIPWPNVYPKISTNRKSWSDGKCRELDGLSGTHRVADNASNFRSNGKVSDSGNMPTIFPYQYTMHSTIPNSNTKIFASHENRRKKAFPGSNNADENIESREIISNSMKRFKMNSIESECSSQVSSESDMSMHSP